MNYQNIYTKICERGRLERLTGRYERHHILPKCMNGTNAKENLTNLTAREHLIAHHLLCKLHPTEKGIIRAYWIMGHVQRKHKLTSRGYARLREQFVETLKGVPQSEAHKAKRKLFGRDINPSTKSWLGRTHTEETKAKLSAMKKEYHLCSGVTNTQ